MLKKLPVKKEYLLLGATVLLVIICYKLALKNTIEAWHLNTQLKRQLVLASDVSVQPDYLQRKNSNLGKIIKLYQADTVAFRNNIISKIAGIAEKENVKLTEVPTQDPFYHTDKFIIQKLGFEGDFFALTKVLNQLQQTGEIGIIRSIYYKSERVRAGLEDSKKLKLEVLLEITI